MEIYQIGLILLTFLSSWLLISPIKMIAMKFKSKKLEDNYPKVFLVIGALLILAFFN
jgi:CDP-diacylglycerol--serine O-phosphatidyltransferase